MYSTCGVGDQASCFPYTTYPSASLARADLVRPPVPQPSPPGAKSAHVFHMWCERLCIMLPIPDRPSSPLPAHHPQSLGITTHHCPSSSIQHHCPSFSITGYHLPSLPIILHHWVSPPHHCPSPSITAYHPPSLPIIQHHCPSSNITGCHPPSLPIILHH